MPSEHPETESVIEKGGSLLESARLAVSHLNAAAIGTGLVANLFSIFGPGVIVINVAKEAGLSDAQTVSWLFGMYFVSGIATMLLSLRYRIPLIIAFSISGAVLVGKLLTRFPFSDIVGAYVLVSLLTFVLTITGVIKRVLEHIPIPIMLAMVGGVLLNFGVGLFTAAMTTPAIYGVMVILFFAAAAIHGFSRKFPPILVSMIVGALLLYHSGAIHPVPVAWHVAVPQWITPTFGLRAILNVGVPMFFLMIGVESIQAVGVLFAERYTPPPINGIYLAASIVSFVTAFMGGHSAVAAGTSMAMCSSPAAGERKDLRFIAAFADGVFFLGFALLARVAVDGLKVVPAAFTAVLAGLAMFDVFGAAFKGAFAGRFRSGAVVAFFVAISNVSIFNVSSAFWAIVFGVLTSLVVERRDFRLFEGH